MIDITGKSIGEFALAGTLLLTGCADYVDNALGINGAPAWNVPMQLEGDWSGRASPGVGALVACLQADSYTSEQAPRVSISVRQKMLTGQLVFADGESFVLSGKTWPGASFTGDNLARADVLLNGRKVGSARFEPDSTSGRLAAHVDVKRPASRVACSMPAILGRVRQWLG